MCIRLGSVNLKLGIIYKDDLVCTVLCQLVSKSLYLITDQDCNNLCGKLLSQLLALSEQFICDRADLIIYLLGEDKYALVFLNILRYHGLPPILDDVLLFELTHNVAYCLFG